MASAAAGFFTTNPSGISIPNDSDGLITLDDPSTSTRPVGTTSTHSQPSANLAGVSTSSPAPLSSTTANAASATAIAGIGSSTSTTTTSSTSSKPPVGSIVGLVFGLLILIGLILFGVRYYFIRKRESKTTAARARVSRLVISAPRDFQHVQSGAHQQLHQHGNTFGAGMGTTPIGSSRRPDPGQIKSVGGKEADVDSPYDRIKQKYSFDLNQLETGLSDHMETMKSSRKPAPAA